MNWGGFAGGFSQGFNNGVSMAKTIRDVIKDRKLQDLREQGMAEAEAQRAKSVQDMVKENGVGAEQPASGPVSAETPEVATSTPVRQATVTAEPLPPVGPKPPEVGASADGNAGEAEAMANMKRATSAATQTPMDPRAAAEKAAQPGGTYTPRWEGDTGPDKVAQTTPQQGVAATGVAPVVKKPNGKFTVNGESFDTREQALAAAEKSAPSATDLFMKNTVPKLAAQYVVNGEPDKAKAWTDYAESVNGKRAIKDWAAAYTAPDLDTATERFGKYYTDHINDGVDYTGHKILTKEDGTQVAVVTLKDKATGKSTEMELTREKMLALGGANNPQKLFEQEQAKQLAADKMKFEAGLKAQERKAKREDDVYMEGVKQGGAMQREKLKQDRLDQREGIKGENDVKREGAKVNAKIDAQVESLRDAGYSDEDIKRMMPAIVGAGDHKKTTDPTERRALIASDLLKNDPRFGRMSKEEQQKRIDDTMGVIYGDEKPAAKPTEQKTSGISDKPMAYDPKLPVRYQRGTAKPFHVIDGQYVPIEGPVPKAGATESGNPAPQAPLPPTGAGAGRGSVAPSTASAVATGLPAQSAPKADAPSYEKWVVAKEKRQALLDTANKMSPDRREAYLASRLPEVEQEIAFHSKYRTY